MKSTPKFSPFVASSAIEAAMRTTLMLIRIFLYWMNGMFVFVGSKNVIVRASYIVCFLRVCFLRAESAMPRSVRVTTTLQKTDATMPMLSVTAKPRIGPLPK